MVEEKTNNNTEIASVSTDGRGGLWVAVVLAAIGVGIILSGIFTGSTGLYGDTSNITFADGFRELLREGVRIVVFTILLLVALRINCWRVRRQLGNVLLTVLRCLAIVALIEAVRVFQMEHSAVRIVLISTTQYVVCVIAVLSLFVMTIRESVLFTTGCTVGVVLLWLGAHVGIWII